MSAPPADQNKDEPFELNNDQREFQTHRQRRASKADSILLVSEERRRRDHESDDIPSPSVSAWSTSLSL
ncbi:hypothetical protein AAC387_Pa10g0273 [Persea americana]